MPMRLKKIKLAGFKSFVDVTQVLFPSNLIGVVGPNGCGKSNIIDAVRWVMGESSAKLLRGESMADVIFNGSSARKPVGQAFVELIFDNSDGSVGGEYAQYNEISIKRLVSRDGNSNYFLNGSRCRRKDITDIFLGTGLGPRSYAIIEQGMISRIIEAKPEDLRVYIEEAAGISKYKERRKETESRIQQTRENLDRLSDIRNELGKQLERLERQAQAAERYKTLSTEKRLLQGQLLALRWHSVNNQLQQLELLIKEQQTQYESYIAKQRHCESQIAQQRETHSEFQEEFNTFQENYYRIGSEIARLEESIQYQHQRKEQLRDELKQAEHDLTTVEEHYRQDISAIDTLQQKLQEVTPQITEQQHYLTQLIEQQNQHEEEMQHWQHEWDEFNRKASQSSQQAHVQQTTIQHIEHRLDGFKQRISRLNQEQEQLNVQLLISELAELEKQHQVLLSQLELYQEQSDNSHQAITELREKIVENNAVLNTNRSESQRLQGRLSSLEALQQAALGKQSKTVAGWLEQRGLSDKLRLAQTLEVEAGWEKAVEVLLAERLQAICLDDFATILNSLSQLEKVSIGFVTQQKIHTVTTKQNSLANKVKTSWLVAQSLLASVYTTETVQEGLDLAANLLPHESIVTRDGVCIGNGWIQIKNEDDATVGVIAREHEIKQLSSQIDTYEQTITDVENYLNDNRSNLTQAEQSLHQIQQQTAQMNAQLADNAAKQHVKKSRIEQLQHRQQTLLSELNELQDQTTQSNEELIQARDAWQIALLNMEQDSETRQAMQINKEQLSLGVNTLKEKVKHQRDILHQQQLVLQSHQSQMTSLQQNVQRLSDQIKQLASRKEQLIQLIEVHGTPEVDLKQQLEEKLTLHAQAENNFKQARHHLEQNEESLNDLEDQKQGIEEQAQQLQRQLEQLRMDGQTYRVQCAHFSEQIQQSDFELTALLEGMPQDATLGNWEQQIASIEMRINRLGAINLVAIDEFKTESERKGYLDAQHEDLTKALDTLESAIRKIDQETRAKFKDTFEVVNTNFKMLFPRLFGGGHAQLTLLDDDLLNSGITVIAKPPGKQNSRIQMLSGGEKALTAVALVFAIFHLNPSPFCMLDEVDAPLDDANVGRYCDLVKEMSEKVQFIFITHNKVTMELAEHLMGVTMHEPGVSRMVSVDVEAAVSLAEV